MNRKPPPVGMTMASAILAGFASDVNNRTAMRFQFIDHANEPGMVVVHDMLMDSAKAVLWHEHAKIAYLMYRKLFEQNPAFAENWMDGHIMGYTLMLTFGAHYPKITVTGEPGNRVVTATMPNGRSETSNNVDQKMVDEMHNRIIPNKPEE